MADHIGISEYTNLMVAETGGAMYRKRRDHVYLKHEVELKLYLKFVSRKFLSKPLLTMKYILV